MGNPSAYGYAHKKARKLALEAFRDGQRCPRCRKPIRYWQPKDLDHIRPVVLGGANSGTVLSHAACNRAHGARLRNRMYGTRYPRRKPKPSRW